MPSGRPNKAPARQRIDGYQPTAGDRAKAEKWSRDGFNQAMCAWKLGISAPTFAKYFDAEYKRGKLELHSMVRSELVNMVNVSMGDFLKVDGENIAFDFTALTPEQKACISELSLDQFTEGAGGEKGNGKGDTGNKVKRVRLKLYSRKDALDSLARIESMFTERIEHSGEVSVIDKLAAGRKRVADAKSKQIS